MYWAADMNAFIAKYEAAIVGIILSALVACGYVWLGAHDARIKKTTTDALMVKWTAERLAIANQTITIKSENEARQATLVTDRDTQLKAKDDQIDKLNADVSGLTDRLRQRPVRPQPGSGANTVDVTKPQPVTGCTGAELYREDGLAFVGESKRAEKIRINLVECQAAYESATKQCGR